jgi:hypothetical protein
MSYKPQNVNESGDRLMSYKPLSTSTPEPTQYERSRGVSVTSQGGESKMLDDKPERVSSLLGVDMPDKKSRLTDNNFSAREDPKSGSASLAAALDLSEGIGGAKIGNIDQVRDILFGGQMRDYEKRFKRVEERFAQESLHLRDDIIQRLRVLEERINGEVESLAEKTKVDRQERLIAQQDFRQELSALKNELNTRLTQLDEQITKELKNLRQQTHTKFQEVTLQMRQQNETLTTLITQEVAHLHEDKVSRGDLAAFFNEMAVRLTRNLERPINLGQ